MSRVIAYYRVSTAAQGRSGLGLDAQRLAVESLCNARSWTIAASYTEVESGKRADRPELSSALHHAKVTGAVLVVAKLDRLSRNVAFLATLQDSGAAFLAADMPEANELTVHIMAAVAQAERKAISKRTKEALAAAKARGQKLGNPNGAAAMHRAAKGNTAAMEAVKAGADSRATDLGPIIAKLRSEGHGSLPTLAKALNDGGYATARGGRWHPSSVRNLLQRLSL
ncbi:MAG: recombinase family protein [Pseudomonadota bacterium]|tara:strand:- start:3120 stop:3797 length:678 start_codon:yes stop_codon:yes gene_type:complete